VGKQETADMTKDKTFKIWIKGNRLGTEREVIADNRAMALIKAGNMFCVKSFNCDAKLLRAQKEI
jgi:hypothetical protein